MNWAGLGWAQGQRRERLIGHAGGKSEANRRIRWKNKTNHHMPRSCESPHAAAKEPR